MGNIAAFFDIDGTLYREGFISDLFKMMVKCEIIDFDKWYEDVRPEYLNWDRRLGTYDTYLLKMAELYVEAVKGKHQSIVNHIVDRVVLDKALKTYVFTRNKIHWHKSQGHKLITISGSPHELVSKIAEFYNFDDYIGTKYLVDDNNIYTGEILPMWNAKGKLESIEYFSKKYDLDLEKCYSYGDTSGDLSMFKSCGHPTMVNPTKELIELVKNESELLEKIKLIVERKDVTYSIDMQSLNVIE